MSETKLKQMPHFATDEEAERFVDEADLSEYDLSGFRPMKLVRRGSTDRYTIQLESELLFRIDARARELGVSIDEYLLSLAKKDLGD
ncbi:CopG family antitoxin [Jiella avicenniae]|uniref:BrnA antitoxin family protein n=1 Tax=Jiella avicenniae TaxID=2907202 RepID=A0A9X1T4G5_9HYPH|nr:CopG family antitoxin [Jiella avicenniae]MCE7027927.1 BrnA antitoxin family protein [Jiella avicenniae]